MRPGALTAVALAEKRRKARSRDGVGCPRRARTYPSLESPYRAGVPAPDGLFARDMRSGERLASCVRSFEQSLTRSSSAHVGVSCITVMQSMGKLKSAARIKSERVLRQLGLRPHSAGAQLRAGDVRDAKRVEHLLKTFKDTTKIPEFLTVPISDWCATPSIRACGFHQVFRSS